MKALGKRKKLLGHQMVRKLFFKKIRVERVCIVRSADFQSALRQIVNEMFAQWL